MILRTIGKAAATVLAPLFASSPGQSFLAQAIRFLEWMQGIGAGHQLSPRAIRSVLSLVTSTSPILFDVGANRGLFLKALLAQKRASQFQVHAFEPGRTAFRKLSASASAASNVTLNQAALSSASGSGVLFYDVAGSELASLMPRSTVRFDHSESVKLVTLDEYCDTFGIQNIHLLKLDVEGHELEVLRGAENMFRRSAIHAVLFEFGGCNVDARVFFLNLYNFFTDHGMKIKRLTPSGYLHEIGNYNEGLERFRTTNYVATY
jgi:FkbM family methyltransferase